MIQRFDIRFIHTEHDENLRKYITRKIGHLDRYRPRKARASAHAEVQLKEGKAGKTESGRGHTCEVTLYLPGEAINVSETSINMYTAVDIIELKLKHRIRKYRDLHDGGTLRRRLVARLAR